MVRRRVSAVSNHVAPLLPAAILRDAASRSSMTAYGANYTTTLSRFAARVMPV